MIINENIDKRYKILIAEDDEINFLYLESLIHLFYEKVDIIHAINGEESVNYVKNNKVDLIFMDLRMPIMDGFEATIEIKKINPKLKIIAQTAYIGDTDRLKAMKSGCDDFLPKPLNKSVIESILNEYMII